MVYLVKERDGFCINIKSIRVYVFDSLAIYIGLEVLFFHFGVAVSFFEKWLLSSLLVFDAILGQVKLDPIKNRFEHSCYIFVVFESLFNSHLNVTNF